MATKVTLVNKTHYQTRPAVNRVGGTPCGILGASGVVARPVMLDAAGVGFEPHQRRTTACGRCEVQDACAVVFGGSSVGEGGCVMARSRLLVRVPDGAQVECWYAASYCWRVRDCPHRLPHPKDCRCKPELKAVVCKMGFVASQMPKCVTVKK